ncbi:hypothetical protein DFH06DRAFT_1150447 [Mycena polygramma]|nr:hypothetical protein DFH06DRAFT_1150447 [Mycena polygramma]
MGSRTLLSAVKRRYRSLKYSRDEKLLPTSNLLSPIISGAHVADLTVQQGIPDYLDFGRTARDDGVGVQGAGRAHSTRVVRQQAVGLLRELPIKLRQRPVIEIRTRIRLFDLRNSLRVPQFIKPQAHKPAAVIPPDIEQRAERHKDLVRARVPGGPLRGVEDDARNNVADLLLCRGLAPSAIQEPINACQSPLHTCQLLEPDLRDAGGARREARVEQSERKVQATDNMCKDRRRREPLGVLVRRRVRGGVDGDGLEDLERDVLRRDVREREEIRPIAGDVGVGSMVKKKAAYRTVVCLRWRWVLHMALCISTPGRAEEARERVGFFDMRLPGAVVARGKFDTGLKLKEKCIEDLPASRKEGSSHTRDKCQTEFVPALRQQTKSPGNAVGRGVTKR